VLVLTGIASAALVAGILYGVSGNSPTARPTASSKQPGHSSLILTAWHQDGSAIFDHSGPGNYSGFTPTTTITCAGRSSTTCYLTVHANGVLPNGELSTPGKWGATATAFISSEFVSTDQGRTWRAIDLPDKAWTSTAFSCPEPRDCAVAALAGAHSGVGNAFIRPRAVVFVTRDGGRTWALRHLPASAGLVRELDCTTVDSCVALTWTPTATRVDGMVTLNGAGRIFPTELYATHDAGRSWTAVPISVPPTGDVYTLGSLTCLTAVRCILTGSRIHVEMSPDYTGINDAHTYVPTNPKTVVITVRPRALTASVELHRSGPVSCASKNHCLMVTALPGPRRNPLLLASTNGGRSWSKIPEHGIPSYPTSLECVSMTSCVLTTGTTTNDGGRHWSRTEASVVHVSCTDSGDCVALQSIRVHDPHVPTGIAPTVGATRVVTNSPR
jgi:photosystem II stability/assembly factor-like uncharacterized protein